jgi:hypothetical protein
MNRPKILGKLLQLTKTQTKEFWRVKSIARRSLSGYTIFEVLIVLAITGVLLVSAIVLVGGLAPETQFSQAAYDMQSKIESEIRSVGNTLFPDVDKYECNVNGTRPVLSVPASGSHTPGTSEECLFLGKALRLNQGSSILYIYSVLGRRTYLDNGVQTAVKSFEQASPTVADELSGEYNNSVSIMRLRSATADGSASPLVGFYSSFSNASDSTNEQANFSLYSKAYHPSSNVVSAKDCIDNDSGGPCNPALLTQWDLCFEDFDGKRTAQISVISNASGIVTTMKLNGC